MPGCATAGWGFGALGPATCAAYQPCRVVTAALVCCAACCAPPPALPSTCRAHMRFRLHCRCRAGPVQRRAGRVRGAAAARGPAGGGAGGADGACWPLPKAAESCRPPCLVVSTVPCPVHASLPGCLTSLPNPAAKPRGTRPATAGPRPDPLLPPLLLAGAARLCRALHGAAHLWAGAAPRAAARAGGHHGSPGRHPGGGLPPRPHHVELCGAGNRGMWGRDPGDCAETLCMWERVCGRNGR